MPPALPEVTDCTLNPPALPERLPKFDSSGIVGKGVPFGTPCPKVDCMHCVWTSNNWKEVGIAGRIQKAGEMTLPKERTSIWKQKSEQCSGPCGFEPLHVPHASGFAGGY